MMELPCLDTKTYQKILEESIGRIPAITSRWTDFNPQDTGILLLEMMAGLTEQLNYMLDQAGDEFLCPYLHLLYGSQEAKGSLQEMCSHFARDFMAPARAATPEDFQVLALGSPFQINQAHAFLKGRTVRLVIFREESPLSQEELQAFSEYMRLRCLLGIELEISQAPKLKANVTLQVQRNSHMRPGLLRRNIARTIEKALQENPLEMPLDEDALTAELLKLPGVMQIQDLQIQWKKQDMVCSANAVGSPDTIAKAEAETITISFD